MTISESIFFILVYNNMVPPDCAYFLAPPVFSKRFRIVEIRVPGFKGSRGQG
jgi:hypothetical protein